jgi:hypothetical protein
MTLQKGRLGIGTDEPQGRLAVADEPDATTYGLQEFPPKPLVGYKTYMEGHGEFCVSATSIHTTSGGWHPYYAFDKKDSSMSYMTWESGFNDYASAAPHNYGGNFSLGGYFGEYIDFKMPYSIKLNNYSVSMNGSWSYYGPKDFMILASNDSKTWDQIHLVSGQIWASSSKPETINYNVNDTKYYNHFALLVTALAGNARRVNIAEIKFFGYREQVTKQSVLHDGQLTLTKSLNVPRIGPALDADDTPRRDRLVVEYNTSTNPTFEGAVRDTSGRGNDGVFYGGASYDATEKALVFDGSGDYIKMRDWNYGTGFVHSFSGWVKIKSPEESWTVLYGVGDAPGAGRTNFTIWALTSSNFFRSEADGSGSHIDHSFEFTGNMDKWMHVAVVKSGAAVNTTRMYINGEILPQTGGSNATSDIALPNSPQNFTLGTYAPSPASEINADYSNIKFYDTALTAEEVKTLYDMGRCDEGHHVVNFSKTRVGIGLGDGEAPRGVLDVRGDLYLSGNIIRNTSSAKSGGVWLPTYAFEVGGSTFVENQRHGQYHIVNNVLTAVYRARVDSNSGAGTLRISLPGGIQPAGQVTSNTIIIGWWARNGDIGTANVGPHFITNISNGYGQLWHAGQTNAQVRLDGGSLEANQHWTIFLSYPVE